MPQSLVTFTLDEAVLSGTEIAAAGGGLPRRIVPAGSMNLSQQFPFLSDLVNVGSNPTWGDFVMGAGTADFSTDPGWLYVTTADWPLIPFGSFWPRNSMWTCSVDFKLHTAGYGNGTSTVVFGTTYDGVGPEIWALDLGNGTFSLVLVFQGGGYGWYQAGYLPINYDSPCTVSLSYDGVGATINAWTMVIDGTTVDWASCVEGAPYAGVLTPDSYGITLGRRRYGDYPGKFSFRNLTFGQTTISAGSASWNFTPTETTTLRSIIMPGQMSNLMMATLSSSAGTGSFVINCPDLSSSMAVEQHTLSMVVNPGEWIATDVGGGPAVVYDVTGGSGSYTPARARIVFKPRGLL